MFHTQLYLVYTSSEILCFILSRKCLHSLSGWNYNLATYSRIKCFGNYMLYNRLLTNLSSANALSLFDSLPEIPRNSNSWALEDFAVQIGFDLFLLTAALRFSFLESVIPVFEKNFLSYAHPILLDLYLYVMLVGFYERVKLICIFNPPLPEILQLSILW